MIKIAFKMQLKEGAALEYKERHDSIWPEIVALLKESGISDYTIFLDEETNSLFAVQKTDGKQTSQELKDNPIMWKWWDYMKDLMHTNSDNSPIAKPLLPIFHLD